MRTHLPSSRSRVTLLSALVLAVGFTGLSADAPTLKQAYKDHFYVGTAINRSIATGTPATAGFSRRTPEQVQKDVVLVKEQFDQLVAENDMKWLLIHPREGADGYNFGPADAFVNFGLSNSMYLVGHTLVWHSQTPNWVFAGTNPPPPSGNAALGSATEANGAGAEGRGRRRFGGGIGGFGRAYTGPRASREELLQRMRNHIHTVVGRYKGKIKVWDVVNEALAERGTNVLRSSLWLEIIGPDFIAKAFQYAHEADPEAILRYNDYGLENPEKRKKLISLIKSLQDQKVPVHAIGSQAHLNVSINFEIMDQALTEMASLGLPIHITELDMTSAQGGQFGFGADIADNAATTQGGLVSDADRRLAEAYAGVFRAFLKHDEHVEMVTFWGPNDANSWRANGRPLLFDADCQPKPAFAAVIEEARNAPGVASAKVPFAQPLQWISSGGLVKPISDATHSIVSVKDPTIVRCNDLWHIYATVYSTSAKTWNMVYLNFKDWSEAPNAKLYYMDQNPNLRGYHCAPQVFYFRPHKKWYLIFQSQQPQYTTTDDISKPESWVRPLDFFPAKPPGAPQLWIDYWVICDDTHAYLFFTGDNGRMYRSRTSIADFPKGMSDPEIVIQGPRNDVFEGSMTYKIKGSGLYLTLVEAIGPGPRYYRAWTAPRLDGEWTPVPEATTFVKPFAGINNVRFADGVNPWTKDVSHGELIREGYDETLTIDPNNLQLLYQGRDPSSGGPYELLPYRLGLLKSDVQTKKP